MPQPTRVLAFISRHAITSANILIALGLVGLIVGTSYGSRPAWPAPVVFYATAGGALLATIHAIVRPMKQTRIAAVAGTGAACALRGASYLLQSSDAGLRLGAAVGAYLIAVGLVIIVVAISFGETLAGTHRVWDT